MARRVLIGRKTLNIPKDADTTAMQDLLDAGAMRQMQQIPDCSNIHPPIVRFRQRDLEVGTGQVVPIYCVL